MHLIRPNCRDHLTGADMDFIVSTLARDEKAARYLRQLLMETEARDIVLDDPNLMRAMLNDPNVVNVSTHLYFYVMVRRELRAFGIKERDTADYVAELLAEFYSLERIQHPLPGCACAMDRMLELLLALPDTDARRQFGIRVHIGNLALWLAGIFQKRIEHNTQRRAAPGVDYFENLGRASFAAASRHQLAEKYHLEAVFADLADSFHDARLALNDMAEKLTMLHDGATPMPAGAAVLDAHAA